MEWKKINEVLVGLPETVQKPNIDGLKLYDPGSSPENPYGYKGRIVLREQFTMTPNVRIMLESPQPNMTAQQLEAAASKDGMLTMEQKGILKVIAGQTTLEEVYRVVG